MAPHTGPDHRDRRESGIDALGAVGWGTHFCLFYKAAEDVVDTLGPYFKAGLVGGECCMWIASEPLTCTAAPAALRAAFPEVDSYLATGQMEIIDSHDWNVRHGRFEAEAVVQASLDKLESALRHGWKGLRLAGSTTWVDRATWKELARFEGLMDDAVARLPILALCMYSLDRCSVGDVVDVVDSHAFGLIRGSESWEVLAASRRARSELALRESEARIRAVFDTMTEGFAVHEIITDAHGAPCDYRFLEANPAFERLTGLRRSEVLGRTVLEVLPDLERSWIETYGRVALTGERVRFEAHVGALGREYEVHAYSPQPGQFATLFTDISERKATEERHAWLASFPEKNPSPVTEVDLVEKTISYMNPASRSLMPELPSLGLAHPWFQGVVSGALELQATGSGTTMRQVVIGDRHFQQTISVAPGDRRARVYGTDISERVQAQQALETATAAAIEERNRLQAVMEALPVGVAIIDSQGGTVQSNSEYERIWGSPSPAPRSVEEYAAFQAWGVETGEPVKPQEWASARAVMARETVIGQILRIRRFDGGQAFVHNSATPILDAGGRVAGSAVAIMDITDLKETEAALRTSAERLALAQRSAGVGIWDWDIVSGRLEWSRELFDLFGTDPGGTASFETWRNVVHPDDLQAAEERIAVAIHDHSPLASEYRIILPTGAVRWIAALGSATYADVGEPLRMTGICIDVTQRRQAEEKLWAALKEKEVLLKEIHHRVKNNLQIVASLLNLQAARIKDEPTLAPLVESQNRIRTLALIHEKLYGSQDLTRIHLRPYLTDLVEIVRRSGAPLGSTVSLDLAVDDVEFDVGTAIPVALIVNELLSNAFKHAFPGGRPGSITLRLQILVDGCYRLTVADDGVGMPADVHFPGAPTMGLELVSVLAEQIDGVIELTREPGTRFALTFAARP